MRNFNKYLQKHGYIAGDLHSCCKLAQIDASDVDIIDAYHQQTDNDFTTTCEHFTFLNISLISKSHFF